MKTLHKFLKPLCNERGAGTMMMAFIASTMIVAGTFAVMMLSGQVSQESSRALASYLADEHIKNALIYTKSLLRQECLVETNGAWTIDPDCRSTGEWEMTSDGDGTHLQFELCISKGGAALAMNNQDLNPDDCLLQSVKVTLLEMTQGNRRKVRVQTAVNAFHRTGTDHKFLRTAIALLGRDNEPDEPVEPDPNNCVENLKSSTINFEEFAVGSTLDNNVMKTDYGVEFESVSGGAFKIAGIVEEGEPEPSFEAWMSVMCSGKPNHNRLCFDDQPSRAGRKILSTTEAMNSKDIAFRVKFVQPVSKLKFFLADVDGGEKWTIRAFDGSGEPLPDVIVKGTGYGSGSGNSALKPYEVEHRGGLISKIEVVGEKNIKLFGFAFDNFTTGLTACPAPTPAPTAAPTSGPTTP